MEENGTSLKTGGAETVETCITAVLTGENREMVKMRCSL